MHLIEFKIRYYDDMLNHDLYYAGFDDLKTAIRFLNEVKSDKEVIECKISDIVFYSGLTDKDIDIEDSKAYNAKRLFNEYMENLFGSYRGL